MTNRQPPITNDQFPFARSFASRHATLYLPVAVCDHVLPTPGLPMILSGNEIKAQLGDNIVIEPFCETQLNANSYNLRLHNELLVYEEIVLDMRRPFSITLHLG